MFHIKSFKEKKEEKRLIFTSKMSLCQVAWILFFIVRFQFAECSKCPNMCNENGHCNSNGVCECFPDFHGVSCSERLCPSGIAWFDYPYDSDMAHADYTECSNMVCIYHIV